MSTQRDKLKELFEKLKNSDRAKYEALLKSLCDEYNIHYEDDEDLEKLLKKLLDKVCRSSPSSEYDKVLKDVSIEIMLAESFKKVFENFDNKKDNDQGLGL